MAFILILFIAGHGGMSGQSGLAMERFDDEKACIAAGTAAREKWEKVSYLCRPVSTKIVPRTW